MNSIWWQVAGWTMIHFLWIGSLVFLVTALVRLVLFRAPPQWRYAASLVGLAVLAVSPLLIALRLASEVEPPAVVIEPIAQAVEDRYAEPLVASSSTASLPEVSPPAPAVIDLKYTPITVEAPSPEEPIVAAPTETFAESQPIAPPAPASAEPMFDPQLLLQTLPSYLPWLWMIGTPATLLLLATGLMGSERLRRRAEPITDPVLLETLARLTAALRIGHKVSLAVSDRVLQPVLVGIVRPLVLLPSVALTSWSPAEIEMALVHELAHVRRWDNMVNLVQRLVESLLFFHPAVWITSRWLRADREHCCDAVVVAHCGNREAYASLLVSVAKSSVTRRLPSPAMAMASHPLAKRVRRILQLEDDPMLVSKRTLLSVAVLLAALTAGAVWSSTLAEETKGEPEASAPGGKVGTTESTEDAEKKSENPNPAPNAVSPRRAIAVFDFPNQGKEAMDQAAREKWLASQAEQITSDETIKHAIARLAEQGASFGPANAIWRVDAEWLKARLSAKQESRIDLRVVVQAKPEDNLGRRELNAVLDSVVEAYLSSRYEPGDPTHVRVLVHPRLTKAELEKIQLQLMSQWKGFKVKVQNDLVSLSARGKVFLCEEILILGDVIIAMSGTGEAFEAHRAARISAAKKTAAAEEPSGEVQNTEDAVDSPTIDTGFTGDTKKLNFTSNTSNKEIQKIVDAYTKAGYAVTTSRNWSSIDVVITRADKSTTEAEGSTFPFPSLEDQRVADLAYGVLGIEIEPLQRELPEAIQKQGFKSGVYVKASNRQQTMLQPGDVVVGVHVWPTANLDDLAKVLRREDLSEFNPLKFYVLRSKVKRQSNDGYPSDHSPMEQNELKLEEYQLKSWREHFDNDTWNVEQHRLKQLKRIAQLVAEGKIPPSPSQFRGDLPPTQPHADGSAPELVAPAATTPIAEPTGTEPIKPAAPQLLYDGRTFDDWRTEWKTELKTENRTEAIKALRAFGRAGYGKEATEAILEVAEEYPMSSIGHDGTPQEALHTAIVSSFVDINDFTGTSNSPVIPSEVTIPIILDWYDAKHENRVLLTEWVLSLSSSKDPKILERVAAIGEDPKMTLIALAHLLRSDPEFESDLTQQVLKKCLVSDEQNVVVSSISQLLLARPTRMDSGVMGQDFHLYLRTLPANLPSLLFHKDQRVRQYARWALKHATPEQLGDLPEVLMGIAERPGEAARFDGVGVVDKTDDAEVQKGRKVDALRAIAAIGPNAESMGERIVGMFEKSDDDTKVFAELALQYIYPQRQTNGDPGGGIPRTLYERMERSMEGRPKVESNVDWQKESAELFPQDQLGGGGFGGDQGGGGMF